MIICSFDYRTRVCSMFCFRVLHFETLKDAILGDDVSALKKSKDLSYKLQEFVKTKVRTPVKC